METLGLNPGSVFTILHGTQQWCVCVRTHHLLPTSCLKQREPTFPMVQHKPLPAAERVPPAKFWYCSRHQEEKKRQQKKSLLLSSFPERQAVRAEQWWVLPLLPWPQMLALLPRRQRALASDKGHCQPLPPAGDAGMGWGVALPSVKLLPHKQCCPTGQAMPQTNNSLTPDSGPGEQKHHCSIHSRASSNGDETSSRRAVWQLTSTDSWCLPQGFMFSKFGILGQFQIWSSHPWAAGSITWLHPPLDVHSPRWHMELVHRPSYQRISTHFICYSPGRTGPKDVASRVAFAEHTQMPPLHYRGGDTPEELELSNFLWCWGHSRVRHLATTWGHSKGAGSRAGAEEPDSLLLPASSIPKGPQLKLPRGSFVPAAKWWRNWI